MGETALDRVRNSITETTAILVTGLWLTLLFVGPGDWWLVVMLVGYVVVVPLVAILADEDEEEEAEASTAEQRESPAGPGGGVRRDAARGAAPALRRGGTDRRAVRAETRTPPRSRDARGRRRPVRDGHSRGIEGRPGTRTRPVSYPVSILLKRSYGRGRGSHTIIERLHDRVWGSPTPNHGRTDREGSSSATPAPADSSPATSRTTPSAILSAPSVRPNTAHEHTTDGYRPAVSRRHATLATA